MTGNDALDDLLADHPEAVVRVALRLRAVLLEGRPELAERVDLVFERGALLPDPHARLTGTGRQVRSLQFPPESDVDPEVVLEYLDLAVELGAASRIRAVTDSASTRTRRPPASP